MALTRSDIHKINNANYIICLFIHHRLIFGYMFMCSGAHVVMTLLSIIIITLVEMSM